MPGREFSSGGYRFGFNGKENDNEVKGNGSQQDYGFRIYCPALGKFLSVDPLTKSYPWNSPYAFAENDVIKNIDLDGLEKLAYFEKEGYRHSQNKNITFMNNTAKVFANSFMGLYNMGYDIIVEKKTGDQILWETLQSTDRWLCEADPNTPGFYEDVIGGGAAMYVTGRITDAVLPSKAVPTIPEKPPLKVNIEIKGKQNWNAAQNNAAQWKADALTNHPNTTVNRSYTRAPDVRNIFKEAGNEITATEHVDHIIELQLNGMDDHYNYNALDGSVNSSFGKQIQNQIKDLPEGTIVDKVTFNPADKKNPY